MGLMPKTAKPASYVDQALPADLLKNPLWFYIRMFKGRFGLGMFFLIITNILDGVYPLYIARVIDLVMAKSPMESIYVPVGGFLLTMIFLAATRYAWRVFFGSYHTFAAEDLRTRLMAHMTHLTPSFYQRNQMGELMSLLINDVQSFRQSIGSAILVLVDGVVIIAVILPLMIQMNPAWTWKTLVFLPLVPFLIRLIMKWIYILSKDVQDRLSELSGYSQESVNGIRVLKSFAVEDERAAVYETQSQRYEKANVDLAAVDSLWSPVMYFGVASGTVILLFVGLDDVMTGAVTLGTLVAFQRYIQKMVWPMTALGLGLSQYKKGMAAFDRIKAVLQERPEVRFLGEDLQNFESLVVKDLTFTYPGSSSPALKNISFTLKPGERIGITGPVGSGKTTLLHTLMGFHPLQPGHIVLNGKDLHDWDEEALRARLTLVPQDVFLFSESVRGNVAYALPESSPQAGHIEAILDKVQILDEMRALPGGLDATLGERGINLSGGQKQRLALARGLIRDSAVVLMDDVLSAVDYKTEESILQQLANMNTACLIVSHRIAALKRCDRIMVINAGEIEALGTFDEVVAQSKFFKDLYRLQGRDV